MLKGQPAPFLRGYLKSLGDRQFMPIALKVALVVGSILFTINHGWAILTGQMTLQRWLAGGLTYIVPYMVNIHGQYISQTRPIQTTDFEASHPPTRSSSL
ncbi:MAG TPA: nitrate/nitrite transporter NrtS [Crinalium sp.]|jgi:hypothetical protein